MPRPTKTPPVRGYRGISAEERIAARRERLLDAGLDLFGTQGYVATGVKDICRQAGLTDRYFYESFRDRAALFTAVMDRSAVGLLVLVARALEAAPREPEAQARTAIESFVRALADDPRQARVLFVETASAGADTERHVRTNLRRFASLVAATGRQYLPGDFPEKAVQMGALAVVGAIERVIIEWQDGLLDASIEDISEFFVQLFLMAGESLGEPGALSDRAGPAVARSEPTR